MQQEEFRTLPVTFHIFSITGSRECEEQVFEQKNAALYQITNSRSKILMKNYKNADLA